MTERLGQRYLAARETIPRLIVPYAYSTHDATDLMGHSVAIDSTSLRVYGVVLLRGRTEMKGKEAPLTSRESSSSIRSTRKNEMPGGRDGGREGGREGERERERERE